VVGCFDKFSAKPEAFVEKFPHHPAICFDSIDEIMANFEADSKLNFYYPTIPHKERDETMLKLLDHYPNAIMLCEKPSHNSAGEAKEF
jgi:predicted dehydrogenase